MNSFVMTGTQKMAFDAVKNTSATKNTTELNQAIRNAINEVCGGEYSWYKLLENKYKAYTLLSEIMSAAENANLSGKFDRFADFHDVPMGDKPYFEVEDNQVYPLYTVSRGNGDIERQKITSRNFTIPVVWKYIRFYDEIERFMANKVDISKLSEKAVIAHSNYVGQLIADTIYGSYASVDTPFKATGAYDATTLVGIMNNVKAATGAERLNIFGDTVALSNIADGFGYSDKAKDGANVLGYYDNFRGTDLIALPQAYQPLTQTFAVNQAHVIILPANEKIVKILFEGDVKVSITDGENRNDMQPEVTYGRRIGAAALTLPEGKFGFYKFA
ncbi:MAG: hypothetical protein PHX62_06270 [Bacilli bacterium]|nr:hypothetical protein [Bacilli bacterium]